MKKHRKILSILLALTLVLSSFNFSFATSEENAAEEATSYMQQVVEALGAEVDGEQMMDYLSYVYLGWRTTGGSWQNQVIDSFVSRELEKAGYVHQGAGSAKETGMSENDMSDVHDKDYSWVTYFEDLEDPEWYDEFTWDPEYCKLDVTAEGVEGADALIERINVESHAFNPTSDTYIEHYGEEYGITDIDSMWAWITEKDASGKRVNVDNGKEAELQKRVHLAWNSCFTEPGGTKPADAKGVTGELVYIGEVTGDYDDDWNFVVSGCSEYEDLSQLEGKVLFTDSSLRNAFSLAQQVGAVAVMSKASLNAYSTPKDENGNIEEPFQYSARYASGASLATTKEQTETGKPIVEWQLSNDQYDALKELLEKAGDTPIKVNNISIGDTYDMDDESMGGKGQAVTFAEIKGSTKPDERIMICAHVQEPGSNDNATGVASLLGIATKMKEMVDSGKLERPERTITFMWGDEMTMARLYLQSHPEQSKNTIAALDMDMTGEDPEKTGGVMRIEKTPDPSAMYNYTLDTLPWEDADGKAYDETFKDDSGQFVRLPDSHTLWGAGEIDELFKEGYYLNDLYMYATQNVIEHHDNTFQVDVCPYEGGSDHWVFLLSNVPSLLTWHFTDYTYHTSVDTLNMSSGREMENVGITTLATAMMMADATTDNEAIAAEMLDEVYAAAMVRFDLEKQNTINHLVYIEGNDGVYDDSLANEIEVLNAWGEWYQQALMSVETYLLKGTVSESYAAKRAEYAAALDARLAEAIAFAEETLKGETVKANGVAAKEEVKGLKFTVNTAKNKTAAITKIAKTTKKTIKIPATVVVDGVRYDVTAINGKALANAKSATKIVVPASVKVIKKNGFAKLSKLKTVKFEGTKKAVTIQKGAFKGLKTQKITLQVQKKLPKKQYNAFVKNLKKINFKGKVKKVK